MTSVPPATGSTSASSTSTTPSTTTASSSSLDQDTFLKLLVAQLKYQDPSSPADATQFLSETAQFSVVQKLDALSTLDQQVLDSSKAQTAAGLIGRSVTYTDYSGASHTGTVSGTTFGSQTPNLTIDGQVISLDKITAVGTVAAPSGAGSSGT